MSEEYNDINTNNIQTTFNNTPNSLALSDELSAGYNFIQKSDTLYARSHRAKRLMIGTGITLIGAGSLLGISNAFITSPPTITEVSIEASATTDSLTYKFVIDNSKKYTVTFTVEIPEQDDFVLDVSLSDRYEGEISNLGYGKTISYNISFTNNVDYVGTLISGTIQTIEEV